jgi:guanylate kinase
LDEARHEIHHYKDYDYVLVNDSVERTSELFKAIVLAERMRPHLLQDRIRPILDTFKE